MHPIRAAAAGFAGALAVGALAVGALGVSGYALARGGSSGQGGGLDAATRETARLLDAAQHAGGAVEDVATRCDRLNAMSRRPECAALDVPRGSRVVTLPAAGTEVARAWAAAVRNAALRDGTSPRRVARLLALRLDVPAGTLVSGIADVDGDGNDDDGRVELRVGGARACVRLPESASYAAKVSGGGCAAQPQASGGGYGDAEPKQFPNSYTSIYD